MSQSPSPLQIDIISDPICPWCFIGKRKLDLALGTLQDVRINLIWRPFQLNPSTPLDGVDYRKAMAHKFGNAGLSDLTRRVKAASIGTGIAFNFTAIGRVPNTLDAHRLIYWAGAHGVQHAVIEDLFRSYFEYGMDIGDRAILLDIGETHGLARDDIAARFETERDIEVIRNADAEARDKGIGGVPAIILGNAFVISGAQEAEHLSRLIRKANARLA